MEIDFDQIIYYLFEKYVYTFNIENDIFEKNIFNFFFFSWFRFVINYWSNSIDLKFYKLRGMILLLRKEGIVIRKIWWMHDPTNSQNSATRVARVRAGNDTKDLS